MRKNFIRIPSSIAEKVTCLSSDFVAGIVLDLTENDFSNSKCAALKIEKQDDGLISYIPQFVPHLSKGRFSKKNIEGYRIRYPEEPKVSKTYYAGERPIFGNYSNGTFSLYITRMVVPYDEIPPKEISFVIRLINPESTTGHYLFKICTNQIFHHGMENLNSELFFHLNLLQENFGAVDVFEADLNDEDLSNTVQLNWDIFPPGERDADLARITSGLRNISEARNQEISERYSFLRGQEPEKIIVGNSGMLRYFGAQFSENLVVFENVTYGNAVYVLFENWRELSRLSRMEIQNRPKDQYIRIKHIGDWQTRIRNIITAKR